MIGAAVLARAEAAGLRLRSGSGGEVTMEASAAPPPEIVADLRRHRAEVVEVLAAREARAAFYMRAMVEALAALQAPDPNLDAERAIIAIARGEERGGP